VASSALLSAACSTGLGETPGKEVSALKKATLKDCIDALKELRDAKNGELDASIVGELDEVIAQLEARCEADDEQIAIGSLAQTGIAVLGRATETVVTELIKAWFDSD
jgi:hypothetical protein